MADLADCFALDFLALRAEKEKLKASAGARDMVLPLLILLPFTLRLRRYLLA
jgi:hypothetical protein